MTEPTSNRVPATDGALWQGTRNWVDVLRYLSALVPGFAILSLDTEMVGFAAPFFVVAAVGPVAMWLSAGRRLAVTSDGLVLRGTPGTRTLPWHELRHVSLRMTGNASLGRVSLTLATRTGASDVFSLRYIPTRLFQQLADDLYQPLHTRGIPYIVESPDSVAATIRMRTGQTPPPGPPPGPVRGLPDS